MNSHERHIYWAHDDAFGFFFFFFCFFFLLGFKCNIWSDIFWFLLVLYFESFYETQWIIILFILLKNHYFVYSINLGAWIFKDGTQIRTFTMTFEYDEACLFSKNMFGDMSIFWIYVLKCTWLFSLDSLAIYSLIICLPCSWVMFKSFVYIQEKEHIRRPPSYTLDTYPSILTIV